MSVSRQPALYVDHTQLKKLLPILIKNRVKVYKTHGLELVLELSELKTDSQSSEKIKEAQKPQDSQSSDTPEIKGEELMSYDQILNWSGTPDEKEIPLPLTGEAPAEGVSS